MKKLLLSALVCALSVPAAALAAPVAPSAPWDGTWKLDVSKSHFEGATFTYSKTAKGMWHFSDGGPVQFDFAADGKPYKVLSDEDTMTTTADGDHAWTMVSFTKGKMTFKSHEVLSADGKKLTDTNVSYRPDGTTADSSTTLTRVSGTNGFEGKWKSTKVNISVPDVYTISTPAPGSLKWVIPAMQGSVEGKIDGTPLKIVGPTMPDGSTLSITRAGERELKYQVTVAGKKVSEGKMTFAADRKTMTDVSWTPGKMDEKSTAFYVKQ